MNSVAEIDGALSGLGLQTKDKYLSFITYMETKNATIHFQPKSLNFFSQLNGFHSTSS